MKKVIFSTVLLSCITLISGCRKTMATERPLSGPLPGASDLNNPTSGTLTKSPTPAELGLREGEVITSINGTRIMNQSSQEMFNDIKTKKGTHQIVVTDREGRERTIPYTVR